MSPTLVISPSWHLQCKNMTYRGVHARHDLLVNGQRELRGQRAVCGWLGLHQITLVLKRFCLALGKELADSLEIRQK